MKYENILVKKNNAAVTIAFNRPEVLNAMSLELWRELNQAILELKKDPQVKVVILRGAGGRAFSVGMDLKAAYKTFATAVEQVGQAIHGCCRDLMQSPKIAVGVVDGYCFGGALELLLACDYTIATENAVFSLPEMNLGLPCMVEAALLVPAVGLAKAREMCYFAWNYDARKGEKMGIVNEVVKNDGLEQRLSEVVRELSDKDAAALKVQKDIIYKWLTTDIETAMQYSILAMKLCQGSPAQTEAMQAFLERKKKT
ncbi:MAG: enoyl-CoA hydratase/isomerase family protein [Dehalococcoidales bacterium]|nr:enoyl-CoA hydratase/isomerase family protein [Dehalococcoidales bacterium]